MIALTKGTNKPKRERKVDRDRGTVKLTRVDGTYLSMFHDQAGG